MYFRQNLTRCLKCRAPQLSADQFDRQPSKRQRLGTHDSRQEPRPILNERSKGQVEEQQRRGNSELRGQRDKGQIDVSISAAPNAAGSSKPQSEIPPANVPKGLLSFGDELDEETDGGTGQAFSLSASTTHRWSRGL